MPLLASVPAIVERHGGGLRPELIGLLEHQESKSKKRISTTLTREVERPREGQHAFIHSAKRVEDVS